LEKKGRGGRRERENLSFIFCFFRIHNLKQYNNLFASTSGQRFFFVSVAVAAVASENSRNRKKKRSKMKQFTTIKKMNRKLHFDSNTLRRTKLYLILFSFRELVKLRYLLTLIHQATTYLWL
jgi:hypothetical protein